MNDIMIHRVIRTKYKGIYITVRNVPVYLRSDGRVQIPRLTQIQLTERLDYAYIKGLSQVVF